MANKKIYIIAGEASGDLHASNLMKAFLAEDPNIDFRYYGGERMEAVGGTLVQHYKELSYMGFWEVLINARTVLGHLDHCKKDVEAFSPDALILVDFPSFNLRMAKRAKEPGIPVYQYISPQIWAWKKKRVFDIHRLVNHVYVILPFETEFYEKYGVKVTYVGHPLLDAIQSEDRALETKKTDKRCIALLPGSRKLEIEKILPVMAELTKHYPNYRFVCTAMSHHPKQLYLDQIKDAPIELVFDQTYDVLKSAYAALVASGTATLETALFNVPQVVSYRGGFISIEIARRLIKVKYISLVNLILDKPLVRELIQQEMTIENLKSSLDEILDGKGRDKMLEGYRDLQHILGSGGASAKTASLILEDLDKQ